MTGITPIICIAVFVALTTPVAITCIIIQAVCLVIIIFMSCLVRNECKRDRLEPWHKFPRKSNYCIAASDVKLVLLTWIDKHNATYTEDIQNPDNDDIYFMFTIEVSNHYGAFCNLEAEIITRDFKKYLHVSTGGPEAEVYKLRFSNYKLEGLPGRKTMKRWMQKSLKPILEID